MSLRTALGRYFQLAPEQLKAYRRTEYRCRVKGCRLGTIVEFSSYRLLICHVHATRVGTVNDYATALPLEGLTVAEVQSWSPLELLERVDNGAVTGAHLEWLYRAGGGDMRQIWVAADGTDLETRNRETFARCRHVRGHFGAEHYLRHERRILVGGGDLHRDRLN